MWQRVERDGFCAIRMEGAAQLARSDPQQLAGRLYGFTPQVTQVEQIRSGDDDGKLRIVHHPYLPPALQLLVCLQQATEGGADVIVDTWSILARLRERGKPLYTRLFEAQRLVRFPGFMWCGATFSLRGGHFVCVHDPYPLKSDLVGQAYQRLIDCEAPVQVRLETGDLLITNNHRTMHARTPYTDIRRHFVRIASWCQRPLAAPPPYVELATRVAERRADRTRDQPTWIRKRLGLGREHYAPEDLLAHYRGELKEDLGRQAQLIRAHAEMA